MNGILISLVVVLGIIAIAVLILIWKIVSFKSKIEDTVVDSIKEVIVTRGPEAVKYVNDKISKPKTKSFHEREGLHDGVEVRDHHRRPQPPKPPKDRILKEGQQPPKPDNL